MVQIQDPETYHHQIILLLLLLLVCEDSGNGFNTYHRMPSERNGQAHWLSWLIKVNGRRVPY